MPESTDSAQERTELTAPPTPQISDASGGQQSSATPAYDEEALVERVAKRLEGSIEKMVQSKQDRRLHGVDEFRDDMARLRTYVAKHVKAGADADAAFDQAARDMALDDLVASRRNPNASQAVPGRTAAQVQQVNPDEVAGILNDAGIKFDDPEVTAWAGKGFTSPDAALNELNRLARKRKKGHAASEGAPVNDQGSQVPPAQGSKQQQIEAIDAQLLKLYKEPSANKAKIAELEKRRTELGG